MVKEDQISDSKSKNIKKSRNEKLKFWLSKS